MNDRNRVDYNTIGLSESDLLDGFTIDYCIEKLLKIKSKIPEGYEHRMTFDVASVGDYYSASVDWEVQYWRYETDEEYQERVLTEEEKQAQYAEMRKQKDLAELKRLKALYEK